MRSVSSSILDMGCGDHPARWGLVGWASDGSL